MAWKPIAADQLNASHLGKPTKIRLKNGKEIYGSIKKVDKKGIWFIPVNRKRAQKQEVRTNFFLFPFLIFLPFGFFTPFILF
ncbi:hypothetical protein [Paludifilum halophilum]|uniref:Uncharacterized protein n=1 Tax=Paludifilum halophilum TaxID=1642702 RepID=A0A235B422_9BACL|nr:hypothetical protein [Paludifilum halophilum]OYD06709.1 hypothetical protein CHM34_14105 [Paludifilum halophilum]